MIAFSGAPAPSGAWAADIGLRPAAGSGGAGFAGDGGPATEAELKGPEGAAVSADGTLYIADTGNHRVRAVGPDGTIRTVAGDGEARNETGPLPGTAKGTEISLGYPSDLALGVDGTLYIADMTAVRIYALAADGTVSVRADATTGRGSISVPMEAPSGVAVSPDGTLYVADQRNNRILVFTPAGAVSEITAAGFGAPSGLAIDAGGDLWISAANSLHRLRGNELSKVSSVGTVSAVGVGVGVVFTVDYPRRVVRVLGADGAVRAVIELDPRTFGGDVVLLGAGTTPDGSIYLIDVVGNRVFSHPAPTGGEADEAGADGVAGWLTALGGVALVAIVGAVILVLRRQRHRS